MVFSDKLYSDEDIANMSVSDNEDLPVSALQVFTDVGVPLVPPPPPDIDRIVWINNNELALMDRRMGEVLVLSMEFCDLLIHSNTLVASIWQGNTECLCLLYSDSSGNARDATIAIRLHDKGLDHWRGVVWNPGIVGQQYLHACCDCLYLMALFRAMMLLVHDRAAWSLWTGTESGYCQTITWELGYWRSINPSCNADRLYKRNEWQIKALEVVVISDGNDNRLQRCAGVRGTSLGVFSAGTIAIKVIGLFDCVGGPVGCSDWLSMRGAVDVRPGGGSQVQILYIRRARTGSSSLDAAPVTGSLVFSVPVYCLAVYCAAGLYSWLLFGGTDSVWLAGGGLFCQRV